MTYAEKFAAMTPEQQKIVKILTPGPAPLAENSDDLDEIARLMEKVFKSGDIIALLQINSYANCLVTRIYKDSK